MKLEEKTLDKKYIYNGKIITLRKDRVMLPNGVEAEREVIEHPGGVCILPLDESGNVIMVSQYRYPYASVLLEAPAGKLTKGEDPLECGIRELKEETGASAKCFLSLGVCYPSVAYTAEIISLYLATGLTIEENSLDEDEFLNIVRIPIEEAMGMVLNNEIPDSKTQIVLLKANELLKSGKIKY